jgi:hypothetical protein
MTRMNIRKANEVEGKDKCHVEVSNGFAVME